MEIWRARVASGGLGLGLRRALLLGNKWSSVNNGTFHDGTETLPDGETATAKVLAQCQLQEEKRQSTKDEHRTVGHQEGACEGGG